MKTEKTQGVKKWRKKQPSKLENWTVSVKLLTFWQLSFDSMPNTNSTGTKSHFYKWLFYKPPKGTKQKSAVKKINLIKAYAKKGWMILYIKMLDAHRTKLFSM